MIGLDTVLQDLRYAVRSIIARPLLAVTIVLTLSLGIGLNASIFTILQGMLFRARVEQNPQTFVHLSPEYRDAPGQQEQQWSISVGDYRAYADRAHSLTDLAAWDNVRVTVGKTDADSVLALLVTPNFFSVYGLNRPKLGRVFTSSECAFPGTAPVVILSEEIWRNRFRSDPQMIGRTVHINRAPFTVVGIMPLGFPGRLKGPGIWIPYTMHPLFFQGQDLFRSPARWLTVEGRLRAGYSRADAQAELAVLAAQQDRLQPGRKTTMLLTNGSLAEEPSLRTEIFWIGPVILSAVMLILAIVCMNVTVLQLARSVARRREMGIRLALGAGRWRLMQMLLAESLLLALAAAAVSALLAQYASKIFTTTLASTNTPVYPLRPDLATWTYMGAIALLAALLSGLSPAAESLRLDLAPSIRGSSAGSGSGGARQGQRGSLVAGQIAICFVLLVTAGLFVRAQAAVLYGDLGFDSRQLLLVPTQPSASGNSRDSSEPFSTALARRVRAIPGVQNVAFGSPISQSEFGRDLQEMRTPDQAKGAGRKFESSTVSAEYFELLQVRIARGRSFTKADEGPRTHVAIVSNTFARTLWPQEDPVGKTLLMEDGTGVQIVGVVPDVESARLGQLGAAHLYRLRDSGSADDPILIHFAGDARRIVSAVRGAAQALDPEAAVAPKTLRTILDEMGDRMTSLVTLVCVLALVAVSLAIIGIYGVVAFGVSRRTKELGIRAALGATRSVIVSSVLVSSARPLVVGLGTGLVISGIAARALTRVLNHTPVALRPGDPIVYVAMALLLGVAAGLAALRPALRAARVDPIRALREE